MQRLQYTACQVRSVQSAGMQRVHCAVQSAVCKMGSWLSVGCRVYNLKLFPSSPVPLLSLDQGSVQVCTGGKKYMISSEQHVLFRGRTKSCFQCLYCQGKYWSLPMNPFPYPLPPRPVFGGSIDPSLWMLKAQLRLFAYVGIGTPIFVKDLSRGLADLGDNGPQNHRWALCAFYSCATP